MEGIMATKIFVRERRKVEKGERRPMFRIVGVSGSDVKIYVNHMRKKELDQISTDTGAQIVFMDAGKGQKDGGGQI
jgi:uncharacterized short protein YbdD (DUF466 family)